MKSFKLTLIILICIACFSCQHKQALPEQSSTKYVFSTDSLKRYKFPTHINDLVIDRSQSAVSEVFMVIVEPGKSVHHHQHKDTEQIFYMLEGTGILSIGDNKTEYAVKPGDVVRIPIATLHSIKPDSEIPVKYLCVDCFGQKQLEPTWDEHVTAVCEEKGWDYNKVINGEY